jgi:N-dimethylarginine dimethylaminohydrolase
MIQVKSAQQVLQEGFQILLSNMEPSTVARFWAAGNLGKGDYLKLKDELFAQESVRSLYSKILNFQSSKREA